MRRILRAGIVYLIIPRLTAFASFHTTQCNNSTNVPRDECTDIAGCHWTIEFSVLIIASTSEMITFHLRAVRACVCDIRPRTRKHSQKWPTYKSPYLELCLKLVLKNDQHHQISPQKRVRLDLRSHGAMLHQRSRTKGHHACAIRPLSHGNRSINKDRFTRGSEQGSVRKITLA